MQVKQKRTSLPGSHQQVQRGTEKGRSEADTKHPWNSSCWECLQKPESNANYIPSFKDKGSLKVSLGVRNLKLGALRMGESECLLLFGSALIYIVSGLNVKGHFPHLWPIFFSPLPILGFLFAVLAFETKHLLSVITSRGDNSLSQSWLSQSCYSVCTK